MSMRAKLSQLFSDFNHASHPSVQAAPTPLGRPADASPLTVVPELVDGLAAPGLVHPGAASRAGEWPVDWGAVREGLGRLHSVLTDALAWIDEIDPTAVGLAQASQVVDLDAHRR